MKFILTTLIFSFIITLSTYSQDVKWERKSESKAPVLLFNSTKVFNLPTAEVQSKGDFYFNIVHRFATPVSEGIGEVWGIDGSVIMRIAFGYSPTDDLMLVLGRSNREGNINLEAKYKLYANDNDVAPFSVSVLGGTAYTGKPTVEDNEEFQFYGSLIANTMLFDKLGLGISPSFLYNSHIYCEDVENTLTFGAYAQFYFDDYLSIAVEANPTVTGWRQFYDSYTVGVELETGGHFFKVSIGNNILSNMNQFMAGAGDAFDSGDLHLGFQIQRTL